MANNSEMNIGRNRIKFINGHLYVNGKNLGIKQWDSDPRKWSNEHGREISEYRGKSLENILKLKGYM